MKIFKILFVLLFLFIGENVMAEEILTPKEQSIIMISSYTACGNMENLEKSVKQGFNNDLTVNEIKEIMVQMYAYCGFPRSLNALSTLLKITKTGSFKEGEAGNSLPENADKHKIGTKIQTDLVGSEVKGELFKFAPAIDDYLKEHLFADIFSRGVLTHKEREIATIAALASMEGVEPQLNAHIQIGKNTGLTDLQVNEILELTKFARSGVFGIGEENTAYAKYFKGQSYLKMLTKEGVNTANVTFEPGCRNNWHIHHKGGQILLVTSGRGYYQEYGKPAQELKKGDVVNIPPETKHWHGAAPNSWFSHVAIEVPAEDASNEWLEEVSDEKYNKLK